MTYKVYMTETFKKEFDKLSTSGKEAIGKIFLQLKENPFVGDAIKYKFFREKRIKEKRLYYLIYENFAIVLVVASEGKKVQQETINKTISLLPEFKKYVEKIFKQEN